MGHMAENVESQHLPSNFEVAKVLEFSFSIIPSKEIPELISFRMDWLDLLPPPWPSANHQSTLS